METRELTRLGSELKVQQWTCWKNFVVLYFWRTPREEMNWIERMPRTERYRTCREVEACSITLGDGLRQAV